jgi:biotin operon repressor
MLPIAPGVTRKFMAGGYIIAFLLTEFVLINGKTIKVYVKYLNILHVMIFKQLNRLQQLDQLIRQKRTGTAEELANKLSLSRRQVYNWIEELKLMGLEIEYNRHIKSFIYLKQYKIDISMDIKELSAEESQVIYAGVNFKQKILCCA